MDCKPIRNLLIVLLIPLLAACGPAATAQPETVTPTPLPPEPALERPTYTVERDTIERVLAINGRVTPVDLVRLSFNVDGRVETINVQRGDVVQASNVLASLQQDEALDSLRQAEDALAQAQRAYEQAQRDRAREIRDAQEAVQQAQEDLQAVLPGGVNDPIPEAQDTLEKAQRDARDAQIQGSEAKTQAEYDLVLKTEALQDAQKSYSDAFWDNDWAQTYGTNPDKPFNEDPATGVKTPNKLTEEEKEEFQLKLTKAERALRDAERTLEQSERGLEQARQKEIEQNTLAEEAVIEQQEKLNELISGTGNADLKQAQREVQSRQRALAEIQEKDFLSDIKAVEDAERALEKAQKRVNDGQIIAPQNGEILALAIREGDNAQAFKSIIEIADPSELEIAAELSADQMRQLAEGQPAEINLLTRPDVIMPAAIRRLPAPYGSGGSGAVQEEDRTTRFEITDLKGQTLQAGSVSQIRIVLERKEDVLVLPPDAINSFEGRRFVIIREGDRDRRVPVEIGIETEELVEIIEGVEEGDIIVGR
ncbi:MAG: HlyD family efflux transporter periplasmic adaptor subunit [Chloroflexales bacterium]|nr:HlyD family efflux transporter periplasmic adaptor subunit [Chloroflexales bacterium]